MSGQDVRNFFPKAEEGPANIDEDRFVTKDDERYTISDIPLRDVGEHVRYTYSITRGHSHADSDEVYYFAQGTGMMYLGDKGFPIKGGDVTYIPEGIFHKIINKDNTSLIFHSISPKIVARPSF